MKLKFKYLLLFFFCFFLCILNIRFFHLKYIFIYNNKKANSIKIENRIYYNKSLGFNYLDMCEKDYAMKFNRKTPNYNSNILITLILIYPNPFILLKTRLSNYIDTLTREIDFNFSIAIITCNDDISDLLINNSFQLNLKYISRFILNNLEIPSSEYFSFVTQSNKRIIDIFYTNTIYSKFSSNFLKTIHHTSISKFKFSGYYAAGTNYYTYAPSHLGIFDFFDFFIKFDHDLIKDLKRRPNLEPFPLKKMIKNNNYFFFSCQFRNDAHFVTTNLYKVFLNFILRQQDKCKYAVLPINLYKYDEKISSVGAVNICWLGFYSMLEIRHFSEEYLSSSFGLYQNRWGDQQFFIPTLYGFNFKKFSYFNKNTFLCSWKK